METFGDGRQAYLRTGGIAMAVALLGCLSIPVASQAADTVRIGLPTKTYWPTIVTEAARTMKLFEKEGLTAEPTVYRGGAECFEAVAAGAADVILDPPSLVATGRNRGVMTKLVAGGSTESSGWHLMVGTGSKVQTLKDLDGKKLGITSAGSASDFLALWAVQHGKINVTRVPLGGGGLVPNLLSGNVDAVVLYSPLSYQLLSSKEARSLVNFATDMPANLTSGWIATDKIVAEQPQLVQRTLNALYGGLKYLRENRDFAVKLIAEVDEIPPDIAAMEYENTILKLLPSGEMRPEWIDASLDLARLGGMKDMAPTDAIYTTQFKPMPAAP
ncbi:MAG TPA: ABC transporter substrate-binding protein [Stellaceae bacterium]